MPVEQVQAAGRAGALEVVSTALTRWSTRFVPDAFVIALVLTGVVAVLAFALTDVTPVGLVESWGGGLWQLLELASQMCLVLLGGYILAVSPPVKRALHWLAAKPQSARGAVALTALVSMGLAL